jgi:CheY-like chemotaxis protein
VEDEQQVVFSVHNQTVMPEDAQRQVFQRHFTTKGRGHGLGTYSMQRISSKYLDGCVWFAVQPQSGTTFYARYPRKLKPVPTHDKQVAVMPDTTSVDLPVLVAEDNRVNALLIERTLKAMGLDCAVVVDGDEAVEAVKKNAYALILMDVQMPHVNGLEATRTIRTLPGSVSQCMILGLTGDRSREALEECLAAGMNAVLNKPLKKKELTGAVSQWLSENNNREQ